MLTVYKYPLKLTDNQTIELPAGSKILSVCEQYDAIVMYAHVWTDAISHDVWQIRVAGTGHPLEGCAASEFIGTVKLNGGSLVFHVYAIQVYGA